MSVFRITVCIVTLIAVAGCKKETAEQGPTPHSSSPAAAPTSRPDAGTAPPVAAPDAAAPDAAGVEADGDRWQGDGVSWQNPDGWAIDTTPVSMRFMTVKHLEDAAVPEIAVTRFPGDVGGVFFNLNRWRTQVGLPPITEDEVDDALESVSGAVPGIQRVDLINESSGQRMIVYIIAEPNRTWFFKMTGATDAIEARTGDFETLVKSVRFP